MGLSADDLAILLDSFEGSEWTELVLSIDGTQLALTKPGAQPAAPPASGEPAVLTTPEQSTHAVGSPRASASSAAGPSRAPRRSWRWATGWSPAT